MRLEQLARPLHSPRENPSRTLCLMRASALALFAGFAALAPASTPRKSELPLPGLPPSLADVVDRVRPAVVMVQSEFLSPRPLTEHLRESGRRGISDLLGELPSHQGRWLEQPWLIPVLDGFGSGIIVDPRGYVLTNAHLVEGFNSFYVTLLDGSEYPARCVGFDTLSDIALLEIRNLHGREFPTLPLGDSSTLRVGDAVMTLGTPLEQELAQSVSTGIVSALGRSVDVAEYENFIQTDCAINPGNSGGPLVNMEGEVVGVTTAIASLTGQNSGIGFAVPIDQARAVADQLLRHGHMRRSYIGVNLATLTPHIAEALGAPGKQGVLIANVHGGTPAAAAGMEPYDIITAIDGLPVTDADELRERVSAHEAGTTVVFGLVRGSREFEVPVELAELTSDVLGLGKGSTVLPAAPPPVPPDSFGVEFGELTQEVAEQLGLDAKESGAGVVITQTLPGSYAAHRMLFPGTRVVEVNRIPISTMADLLAAFDRMEGDLLLLRVEKVSGRSEIVALHRGL